MNPQNISFAECEEGGAPPPYQGLSMKERREWYNERRRQLDRDAPEPRSVYSDKVVEMFPSTIPTPPNTPARVERRRQEQSLPFSEDGEKGLLCSLLLEPGTVAPLCADLN